ncbi:unnamed protein product [Ectocarpus sp. 6 AP-2014]
MQDFAVKQRGDELGCCLVWTTSSHQSVSICLLLLLLLLCGRAQLASLGDAASSRQRALKIVPDAAYDVSIWSPLAYSSVYVSLSLRFDVPIYVVHQKSGLQTDQDRPPIDCLV